MDALASLAFVFEERRSGNLNRSLLALGEARMRFWRFFYINGAKFSDNRERDLVVASKSNTAEL